MEDTPWAYLARHSVHVEPSVRQQAHRLLAPLALPAYHIVLHTTGVTVGRRHPTQHTSPEQYSPHALRQMGLLAHLPSPLFHVDATAAPDVVCTKVQGVLTRKIFRVQHLQAEKAEVQGMEHVSGVLQPTPGECKQLAQQLHLTKFDTTTPQGLQRLARLATIYQQNPAIVNTELDAKTRGMYFQVIHDHVHAFALSLDDLKQPCKAQPFKINTFGAPCYRPPIRCSPTHMQHMRAEFEELKRVGLVCSEATPWASPCFCVPKPRSDKLRIVIDFRPLNLQTIRDSHPIPHARDVIQKLRKCKVYLKLDLKSGFW